MPKKIDNKHYTVDKKISFCTHFNDHLEDNQFCEVTEWTNGEGFDVTVNSVGGNQRFGLTYGQWEALQVLVAYKE
jgi:hypothetical protein